MNVLRAIACRRGYFVLSLLVLLFDQVTKVTAHAMLAGGDAVTIIPGLFNLDYSRNPGGLFGYFGDWADPWRTLVLTALPLVAVGLIGWFLASTDERDRKTLTGLALILGGAVGNLIDRIARGEVVDFLDVYVSSPGLADWLVARFGTAHWPTFNLADSAIVVGACLLLLTILRTQPATQADGSSERAAPAESGEPR